MLIFMYSLIIMWQAHIDDTLSLITQLPFYIFRDLRQEVTVLAQLSHPNIVALLGVSIRPMCMVIEFAPMGSLFGTLDKTVEQIKQDQADRASVILRMPGGVLGREITMKIALQVRWYAIKFHCTCMYVNMCTYYVLYLWLYLSLSALWLVVWCKAKPVSYT